MGDINPFHFVERKYKHFNLEMPTQRNAQNGNFYEWNCTPEFQYVFTSFAGLKVNHLDWSF